MKNGTLSHKNLNKGDFNPKTIFIKKGTDFYEILVNSDVVISTESTGLLEAIAMDVPVIQVNFSDQSYTKQCDLSTFGGRKPIEDAAILTKEVLALIGKDEKREHDIYLKKVALHFHYRIFALSSLMRFFACSVRLSSGNVLTNFSSAFSSPLLLSALSNKSAASYRLSADLSKFRVNKARRASPASE